MIIIPSILHADKRAYKLQRSGADNYHQRGNAPLLCELTQFETYGDSTVQHSSDWCPQFSELVDVCLSLTTAMLAEPKAEHWAWLPHQSDNLDGASLRFALSVKFKESKNGRQYFSWSERKITTADKRNDRRFERVETWHEGTPSTAFAVINPGYFDWLEKVRLAMALRDEYYLLTNGYIKPAEVLKCLGELPEHWQNALDAYGTTLKAVRGLGHAARSLEICHHNLRINQPPATDAAA